MECSYVLYISVCYIHSFLYFTGTDFIYFVLQSVLGLAYSLLASALWPMVSLIIPEHQLGTAYGM